MRLYRRPNAKGGTNAKASWQKPRTERIDRPTQKGPGSGATRPGMRGNEDQKSRKRSNRREGINVNTRKPFDDWVQELRQTRGIDLSTLGDALRLRCFLNGVAVILSLRRTYDEFCTREYAYVLPLDQFNYQVGGFHDAFTATQIAGASGCGFLRLLMRTILSLTFDRYEAEFPHATTASFYTAARRARDLLARVPLPLHLFKSERVLEGPSAFQHAYRRSRSRSCILIVGAAIDTGGGARSAALHHGDEVRRDREDVVPWDIFELPLSDPQEVLRAKEKLEAERRAASQRRKLEAKNRPRRRKPKQASKVNRRRVDADGFPETDEPDDLAAFMDDDD